MIGALLQIITAAHPASEGAYGLLVADALSTALAPAPLYTRWWAQPFPSPLPGIIHKVSE